jgi:hypothetical protein
MGRHGAVDLSNIKEIDVDFGDGYSIRCVGWIDYGDAEAEGVDEEGGVGMKGDSFTIHVLMDGVAIDPETGETPLGPGAYLVTSGGVFMPNGQLYGGASPN